MTDAYKLHKFKEAQDYESEYSTAADMKQGQGSAMSNYSDMAPNKSPRNDKVQWGCYLRGVAKHAVQRKNCVTKKMNILVAALQSSEAVDPEKRFLS